MVFQKEGTPSIHYVFVDERTDVAIGKLPGSYQPDDGSDSWAMRRALETQTHWHRGSTLVALEEASWHGIGTVLPGHGVKGAFRLIPLNEDAILRATHAAWSRLGWGCGQDKGTWRHEDLAAWRKPPFHSQAACFQMETTENIAERAVFFARKLERPDSKNTNVSRIDADLGRIGPDLNGIDADSFRKNEHVRHLGISPEWFDVNPRWILLKVVRIGVHRGRVDVLHERV